MDLPMILEWALNANHLSIQPFPKYADRTDSIYLITPQNYQLAHIFLEPASLLIFISTKP